MLRNSRLGIVSVGATRSVAIESPVRNIGTMIQSRRKKLTGRRTWTAIGRLDRRGPGQDVPFVVNGRLKKGEPCSPKRHIVSTPTLMPIRFPITAGHASPLKSWKGGSRSCAPLKEASIPSARQSLPGPEHRRRKSLVRRRELISTIPCVGSSARIRTALPRTPQTRLRHQCSPYMR